MSETSYPRSRIRITLLEHPHPAAAESLQQHGYSVEIIPRALEGDELRQAVAGSHVLGVRSRTKVREEHLAGAGRMLAIGCFSVGTDQVDIQAAARRTPPPGAWRS
jgi:D-3-phosphoglycerate dehydrogenase / 2-oxoglutarate reductase